MSNYCQICGVEIHDNQDFCLACLSQKEKQFSDNTFWTTREPKNKSNKKNKNARKEK